MNAERSLCTLTELIFSMNVSGREKSLSDSGYVRPQKWKVCLNGKELRADLCVCENKALMARSDVSRTGGNINNRSMILSDQRQTDAFHTNVLEKRRKQCHKNHGILLNDS